MSRDVFISASSKDRPAADTACETLEARGISCWIAPRDIPPGSNWSEAIMDALGGARVVVLIYSAHANTSQHVLREVERAVDKDVLIVSFHVDDAPLGKALEYFLSTTHWLSAGPAPTPAHFTRLADAVERFLHSGDKPEGDAPPGARRRRVSRRVRRLTTIGVVGLALGVGVLGWSRWRERSAAGRGSDAAVGALSSATAADALRAKTDAQNIWGEVKDAEPLPGLATVLDEAAKVEREAEQVLSLREFGEAQRLFLALSAQAEEIRALAAERSEAQDAVTAARAAAEDAKKAGADVVAMPVWSAAGQLLGDAQAAIERGSFQSSRASAERALQEYARSRAVAGRGARVLEARRAFEETQSKLDVFLMKRQGGEHWLKVEQTIARALEAGEDFDAAVEAYRQATALLPAADAEAKAAYQRNKLLQQQAAASRPATTRFTTAPTTTATTRPLSARAEQFLAAAMANDQKSRARQGLVLIEQVLAENPSHVEALKLKGRLRQHLMPKTHRNSLGASFVGIAPGEFVMGSPPGEPGREEREVQHRVLLTQPFLIGAHEVTVRDFDAFVRDTGYKTLAEKEGFGLDKTKILGKSWRDAGYPQSENMPVVYVSWDDANAFCEWLSKREGRHYRLPSEAEWEYVCRAGSKTAYPWGDDPAGCAQFGNVREKAYFAANQRQFGGAGDWDDGFAFTAPVGTYKPNAWGVYDMLGNVVEWCADKSGPFPEDTLTVDPTGNEISRYRCARGSQWGSALPECRSARRRSYLPHVRTWILGFRVVLEVE